MKKTLQRLNSYWTALREGLDSNTEEDDVNFARNAEMWQLNSANPKRFPSVQAAKEFIAKVLNIPVESLGERKTLDNIVVGNKGGDIASITTGDLGQNCVIHWNSQPKYVLNHPAHPGKLNEEAETTDTDVPHGTKETEVDVEIASDAPTKTTSKYGKAAEFVLYKDTNSKTVSEVPREMGVKEGPKSYEVNKVKMDTEEPVPREMGVQESPQEFKINKVKMDTEEPVPREMGSKEAPKVYLEEYKRNISKTLDSIKETFKI